MRHQSDEHSFSLRFFITSMRALKHVKIFYMTRWIFECFNIRTPIWEAQQLERSMSKIQILRAQRVRNDIYQNYKSSNKYVSVVGNIKSKLEFWIGRKERREFCCAVAETTALKANFRWTSCATQYPVLLPKVYTTACLNPCTRDQTRWSFTNNAQNNIE
jgi:hypothetical protein